MKPLSHVRLLATTWTAAHQAPPSMGFSRRVLEWGAIAFSNSCKLSTLIPMDSISQCLRETAAGFAEMFGVVVLKLKQGLGWGTDSALPLVSPILLWKEGQGPHSQDSHLSQAVPSSTPDSAPSFISCPLSSHPSPASHSLSLPLSCPYSFCHSNHIY